MANPTAQEFREAVGILAERMGYGKLYDRLLRLNAFVSRRRPATPDLLADRLYNLSGGLRRQVPATIAFHTAWAECIGGAIGEEHEHTLEAIADKINATLTADEHGIQDGKADELAAALGEYEQVLVSAVGPQATRLDMLMKAVHPVADALRARPLPAATPTAAPAEQS
jgi:hypothetical protein